jgi:hypothetical protein
MVAWLFYWGKEEKMKRYIFIIFAGLLILLPQTILAIPVVLDSVPSYNWYHGCSPTASANIMGYWDLHGYADLFDASGADVMLTANVGEHIASTAHHDKYASNPDNPDLPEPPDTSLADFMHTSEGGLNHGWTYISNIDNGMVDYAAYRGYEFSSEYITRSWDNLVAEIDMGNPTLINVDSNGDGGVDHSMTGIGYEDRGDDGFWYASYNTWHEDETIDWYEWRPPSDDYGFGVSSLAYVHPWAEFEPEPEPLPEPQPDPQPAPVPEPSTMILLGFGLFGIVVYTRKNLKI